MHLDSGRIIILVILLGLGLMAIGISWMYAETLCPKCGYKLDYDYHGYDHRYGHCHNPRCGYCEYDNSKIVYYDKDKQDEN